MVADFVEAVIALDDFNFSEVHVTGVEVNLKLRRGLRQAFILGASGPRVVHRGHTILVRLRLRRTGSGATTTRTLRLRVPLTAPTGLRTLRLKGTPADSGSDPNQEGGDVIVAFQDDASGGDDSGPESLRELRETFESLARYNGITARLGGEERRVFTDPRLRISGEARVRLRIRR